MKVNLRWTYVYAPDGIWKTIPDEPGGVRSWIPTNEFLISAGTTKTYCPEWSNVSSKIAIGNRYTITISNLEAPYD